MTRKIHNTYKKQFHEKGRNKGAARYLCYPEYALYHLFGGRVAEADFIGMKYIFGRTEPLNFIGFSFKKEPKLRYFQRISGQTAQEFKKACGSFFKKFEKPDFVKVDNCLATIRSASGRRNISQVMYFLLENQVIPIFAVPRKPFSQASIAAVNFSFPILLLYSFDDNLNNPWLPLTALPYYFFYGRDLIQAGYHMKDIFRVYALNLLLVPVNLGGLLKSIEQGITKKKIPFRRTPKVMGHTTSPVLYLVIEFVVLVYFFWGSLYDIYKYQFNHALFGFFNGMFFLYAFKRFIGFKKAIEDIKTAFQKPTTVTLSHQQCLCHECATSIDPANNLR